MKEKTHKYSKKNKKGILLLALLSLIMAFNTLPFSNVYETLNKDDINTDNNNNPVNPYASIIVNPLTIVNNWSATAAKYSWIKGTGYYWDPYIIENVTINVGVNKPAIYIEGSRDFFVIRNCTILKTGTTYNPDGIQLKTVENGRIENNIIKKFAKNIFLLNSKNIKILKNQILNSTTNGTYIESSDYNSISQNSFYNNSGNALNLYKSKYNTIFNNSITSNLVEYALKLRYSNYTTIDSNNISNNKEGIRLIYSHNNMIVNNHLNTYKDSSSHAIYLDVSNYNSILYNEFKYNYFDTIQLYNSDNNLVENNNMDKNYRNFNFFYADNNIISKNNITNGRSGGYGFDMTGSLYNIIKSNKIYNISQDGIRIYQNSNNNTIQNNYIFKCSRYGINIDTTSNYNKILANTILNSTQTQIVLKDSRFAIVEYNLIANGSYYGIICAHPAGGADDNHTIRYNTIQNHFGYGVFVSSQLTRYNKIYLNNFINNNKGASQGYNYQFASTSEWYSKTMKLGNYWNNHTTPDKSNDGVVDRQYKTDGLSSNHDIYPLKYPFTYYNLSVLYVDKLFNNYTIGWNITRFNSTTLALNKLNIASYFKDKSTIYINDGTYKENLMITRSNIQIVGKNKKKVIIDGNLLGSPFTINNAQNIVLSNLTIINSRLMINNAGVFINSNANNNTVQDCVIYNNFDGVFIQNSRNNLITKCNITLNAKIGIHLTAPTGLCVNNRISQNNISNNMQYGIQLENGNTMNNNIEKNKIFSNSIGIVLNYSKSNLIKNNTIWINPQKGIVLNQNADSNTITENNIDSNGQGSAGQWGYGIQIINPCMDNKIYLNDFRNNNNPPNPIAQGYDNDPVLPMPNKWDNSFGPAFMFLGNYWQGWAGIDADQNGVYDLPYQIQPIPLGFYFDNFPLVYPYRYYNFSEIYVDDDFDSSTPGWQVTRFDTIQAGINVAANGAIIHINNGTYTENIGINKPCSIIGQLIGSVKPKIIRQSDGDVISIGGVNKVSIQNLDIINSTDNGAGVSVQNSQKIFLRNLNITNTILGISVINSNDTTIENCIIDSISFEMYIEDSNFITLTNNTVFGLLRTSNTAFITMRGNKIYDGGWLIGDYDLSRLRSYVIETTNKVNDKSIIYLVDQVYSVVENRNDIGQLILANVNNSVLYNNSIPNSFISLYIIYSNLNDIGYNDFNTSAVAIGVVYSNYNRIIANWIENAQMVGVLLEDSNSTKIYGNKIQFSGTPGAIYLNSVSKNNAIYANTINNNSNGIFLDTQAQLNNIYQNRIENNSNYGVCCNGSSNRIWHNNFYNNGHNQSYNTGTTNIWNSTYSNEGNYWSNYRTRYPLATKNGGIWNTPYRIDGILAKYDYSPLVNPYPLGPTITTLAPANNSVHKTAPSISVKIVDANFTVDTKWFTINGSSTKHFFTTNASIDLNWASLPSVARLNLRFFANNTYSFESVSDIFTIYKDTIPPTISNINYNSNVEWSTGSLSVNCSVVDNFGLRATKPVEITVYNPSSVLVLDWAQMTNSGGSTYIYNWPSSGQDKGTNYYFKIRANDLVNNTATTTNQYFNIRDTVLPSVTLLYSTPQTDYGTGWIFVNANVSDTYGLQLPVQIRFYRPSSVVIGTYSMSLVSGNTYKYNWSVGSEAPGISYFFRIIATDQSGNVRNNTVNTFNINDIIKPSVVVDTFSASAEYSTGTISVTSTITDNHQIQAPVNITFSYPNGTAISTYAMNNPGGNSYTYSWSVGTRPPLNNYRFTIAAKDPSGNVNNTVYRLFNIVDSVFPTISNIVRNSPVEWKTGQLTATCNATDNYKLRTLNPVEISIYYPNGSLILNWIPMSKGSGTSYSYNWLVIGKNIGTNYYFKIRATDNVSNVQTSGNQYFEIKDTVLPNITNIAYNTPIAWNTGTLQVSCNVTDNYGLRVTSPVEIIIYNPSDTPITSWLTMTKGLGTGYSYSWSVSGNPPANNYKFKIRATDVSANENLTVYKLFNIIDTVKPNVILITYYHNCTYGGSIYVKANATDNYQLKVTNPVSIKFYYSNGTLIGTYIMTNIGGNSYSYTWAAGTKPPQNNYNFTVIAEDSSGNINKTIGAKFNITDTISPTINSPAISPNPVPAGNSTAISATVFDNYKLADTNPVGIKIYDPTNALIHWAYLVYRGSNFFNTSWDSTGWPVGNNYYIVFNATDKMGNLKTTTLYFNIISGNPPVISNPKIAPIDLELNQNLTISANATDNILVVSVKVQIYYPNGTLITIVNLKKDAFTNWSVQWNSTVVKLKDIGNNFYVVINATDNQGISSWTANLMFDIITTKPVINNPAITPAEVEYGGALIINATVTDNKDVVSVIAYIYYPNGTLINSVSLIERASNLWNGTWSAGTKPVLNIYFVVINATDNDGFVTSTGHIASLEFDIVDTTDPQVADINFNVNVEWSTGQLIVNCNATDNYKLRTTNPVEFRIFNPIGVPISDWTPMTHGIGNTYSFAWSSTGNPVDADYLFYIRATDTSNNILQIIDQKFNIVDTVDPSIMVSYFNAPIEWSTGQMNVLITATDNYQLRTTDPVQISYYYLNDTLISTYIMSFGGGDHYYYNWSVGANDLGTYYFVIIVYDSSDNAAAIANQYFTIVDRVKPTIDVPIYNTPITYKTGSITINVSVSDNYKLRNVAPVNITFYYPNATMIVKFTMNLYSGSIYTYTWVVGLITIGNNYYFVITAIDNQTNSEASPNKYFNIVDNEAPLIFMGGYDTIAEYKTGSITVNVTVVDNYMVQYVRIKFYNPSGGQIGITRTMISLGNDKYMYIESVTDTIEYTVDNGYFFVISTRDYTPNNNETSPFTDYFNIVDTTKPSLLSLLSLINMTYYKESPTFNIHFDENVALSYFMSGMTFNRSVGSDTNTYINSIDIIDFNGLLEGWFNLTFYFEDAYNNLNSTRLLLFKDTTKPSAQFSGTSPDGKEYFDNVAPVFYINVQDAYISAVKYYIPSKGIERNVNLLGGSALMSGLKASELTNFPVQILMNDWALVDYGSVQIIIEIFDRATNNATMTFYVIKVQFSQGGGGDDTTPSGTETSAFDMTLIIVIVIGALAAVGAVTVVRSRGKKKAATKPGQPQKLQIKAPSAASVVPGKMLDGKVVGEKAKKAKLSEAAEPEKRDMTPEELAQLTKAEEEMQVEKKQHVCIVHKGPIKGAIYLCPKCETFYCMTCARTLRIKGEKCWACEADIDVEVSNSALLEELSQYDATFKKAMTSEKHFGEVSQLDNIEFSAIDPTILKRLDDLNLMLEKKAEIIKDLMGLSPAEQEVLFDSIFTKEEEETEDQGNEQQK